MSREAAIRKMMQACHENPDLHKKLLEKPQDVAKEHGLTLEPEELQQLQRVKKLQDLVEEFKAGRGIHPPIGYPIDVLWKKVISYHIIWYRPFYPLWYRFWYRFNSYRFRPSVYTIGYYLDTGRPQVGPQFTGLRNMKK
jgi:hypothetical protein